MTRTNTLPIPQSSLAVAPAVRSAVLRAPLRSSPPTATADVWTSVRGRSSTDHRKHSGPSLAALHPSNLKKPTPWNRQRLERLFDALWPRVHYGSNLDDIQELRETTNDSKSEFRGEPSHLFLANYQADGVNRMLARDRADFLRLSQRWITPEGWTSLLDAALENAGPEAAKALQRIRNQNARSWPIKLYKFVRDIVSEEGRSAGEPIGGIDLRNVRTSNLGTELRARGPLSRSLWNDTQYTAIRTLPARSLRLTREDPLRAWALRASAWLSGD